MKQLILALCVSLAFSASLRAQFNFGARAGLTSQQLTIEEAFTDTEGRLSLFLGGFIRYGEDLFVQPELNWARKVTQVTFSGVVFDDASTEKLGFHTLNLPVMIGYKLISSEDGSSSVRLMAGPVIDFLLKVEDNDFQLVRKDFNTTTMAVEAGVGLDLWILTLDARYNLGLSQFLDADPDVRSRLITLSAGIKL